MRARETAEAVGRVIGGVLSPIAWLGSLTRGKRLFHPDGVVYRADVTPLVLEGSVGDLAQRLAGPALVRLSGGTWEWHGGRTEPLPDVLGVAMRFLSSPDVTPKSTSEDQDLLFLSTRALLLLPVSMFTTNRRDYLANNYYAILPFEVAELGRVTFRLVPLRAAQVEGNRNEKLEYAVRAGLAVLRLEVREAGGKTAWTPVADITLREKVDVDQQRLHFDPFLSGRGIVPVGLLQATRLATYMASLFGRALTAREVRSDV